jgi:hypothetical protein
VKLQQSDQIASSLEILKHSVHDLLVNQRAAQHLQGSLQSERAQFSAIQQEISAAREAQQAEQDILNEQLAELTTQYNLLRHELASLQVEGTQLSTQHQEFSGVRKFVEQVLNLAPVKPPGRFPHKQSCRNCGSQRIVTINSAGRLAPFFAARVLGLRGNSPTSLFLDAALCIECLFLTHAIKFPEECISNLYQDYRGDAYNSERISFEPDYSLVAGLIGGPDEINARNSDFDKYIDELVLEGLIDFSIVRVALDWGGAKGGYAPSKVSQVCDRVHVFDISNSQPADADLKGDHLEQDAMHFTGNGHMYDYIQFCHVLEHLQDPLASVRDMVENHLRHGGYLYIEVPIEEIMCDFASDLLLTPGHYYLVHEHINKYCLRSIRALIESVGQLSMLDLREDATNVGWILPGFNDDGMVRIIRCLCQKVSDPIES